MLSLWQTSTLSDRREQCTWLDFFQIHTAAPFGLTEIAGQDNDGQTIAGPDFAGQDNDGQTSRA